MRIALTGYAHPFGQSNIYGAERVIWYLIKEYLNRGHEVTVFSVKGCTLSGCDFVEMPAPWKDDEDIYFKAIQAKERSKPFDFIHSYMASGKINKNLRSKAYCLEPFFGFSRFTNNIIAYSHLLNKINGGKGTVIYFGIPEDFYGEEVVKSEGYLAWIGRIDAGKAPHIAIEVAKRAGKRLIIMGNSYHYPYFVSNIWPHIDGDRVIWLRGVDDEIKKRVLRKAEALVSTNWNKYHEMFGIVNIEALACGAPVIGWGRKSEPSAINFAGGEIIKHGLHGFINEYNTYSDADMDASIDAGVRYVNQLGEISREECQKLYKNNFTSAIMADKHLKYYDIVKKRGQVFDITKEL